ncbi:MAG: NAD-dependent epimerase/dehydratase family protein [Chitinophagales bacterium]|nr:NAD-dependent epimerase/dehydratase family protein [Chitinophagales bacterium]MDW8418132.1 NAD-dependent epimerase/dehydratase family protein [Chitinophagales bacterium]
MRVAITGANGFIGSQLAAYLEARGDTVQRWVRKPRGENTRKFELKDTHNIPSVAGLDALVHTAYMPYSPRNKNAYEINVKMAGALAASCGAAGVHFVFLSSLSAHEGATSVYGLQKRACERSVLTHGGLVIRPGLVIGSAGLYKRISDALKRSRIVPIIDGGRQPVQVVAIEDLVKAIAKSIDQRATGILTIATERAYTMREFYQLVGRSLGVTPLFLPVPYSLIYGALWLLEKTGIPSAAGTDNLKGLKNSVVHRVRDSLEQLQIEVKGLEEILCV